MKLYPDYIKRWGLRAIAVALIMWTGCSDDMETRRNNNESIPSECLAFTTYLAPENTSSTTRSSFANLEILEEQWPLQTVRQDSIATRGEIVNHLSGSAGVLGFQYNDEKQKKPIVSGDNNLEFTFDGDKLISKNTTILWKTITYNYLNVYAYAPYVPTSTTSDSMKLDFKSAPPLIDYIVPDDIANQKDLLVARWISKNHSTSDDYKNKTIPLTFNHILTAIRFRVGFECRVKSVEIRDVYNSGIYNLLEDKWMDLETTESSELSNHSYKIDFSQEEPDDFVEFEENALLTGEKDLYMILMPQTLPNDAQIVLTCVDEDDKDVSYTANIGGKIWEPGKLITYTFYKDRAPETIYFDLAAGNVMIDANSYKGFYFDENGEMETQSGEHKNGNHYYVYQSTKRKRIGIWKGSVCTPPTYPEVKGPDNRPWREFITNNTDVDYVIKSWSKDNDSYARAVGREGTENRIHITGGVTCKLTIDNIYSIYQNVSSRNENTEYRPDYRTTAGIAFIPGDGVKNAEVTINIVGDNRVGAVHYDNQHNNGNKLIFEGTGSLTVADVDGYEGGDGNTGLENGEKGYWSNHWSSAIGNHDSPPNQDAAYGIVINSGIIFAGTTKAENCTAIGGGGNAYGEVTINGGTVTAVATTTGTAIGGGIGFGSAGGKGKVEISGGNVYAYNHANKWGIPSSAIGGAGSRDNKGEEGIVMITGGYVYAESALGTAIGGGSSQKKEGGNANVIIKGGEVFAKTRSDISASIGGGTACSGGNKQGSYDGGSANITVSNNPIIRTGSIGGGGTGAGRGHIGNATIDISGGDIQAQFLLSAGTGTDQTPCFTMTGGTIRNSDTADEEYLHVKKEGGAVYLENGAVEIIGGTIKNCKAEKGGAIYIKGEYDENSREYNSSFTMTGGKIEDNEANRATGTRDAEFIGSGGAVYIIDGEVELNGGTISDNLAAGGNGGGIFIRRGSLYVGGDTKISNNACEIRTTDTGAYSGGNGGGIYVYSKVVDVDVWLESGKITGNTADRRGGGLCVIQDASDHKANVTLGTSGGEDEGLQITHNHTLLQGGGVYAKGVNADITIHSGTIQENTVSQYAHNPNVANELGSVTLNGGNVTHNVVTFNANYGENPDITTQEIVTETNSKLITPGFTRTGYKLVKWNTKPSGAGDYYALDAIMNINKDITLYAQWVRNMY